MKARSIPLFVVLGIGLAVGFALAKLFDPRPSIVNPLAPSNLGSPRKDIEFFKTFLREQIYPNLPREGFLISGHGENDIWVGGNARVEDIVKFGESYLIIFKANNTFDEINKRFGPMYALVVYAASEGTYKNIATDLDAANFYIGYENATEAKAQASVDGLDRVFVRFFVQSGGRSKVCRLVEVVREGSEVRIEPNQECPDSAG